VIGVGTCSYCGEPWPSCACGTRKPPPTPAADDDAPAPLVEWVQWRRGGLFHVRLNTGGDLACGRTSPPTAPADSFPPVELLCSQCLVALHDRGVGR
jgi:hypothetical protein